MILEAQNLGLCYGEKWVLSGVGFTLHPGSLFAVLGPNGAGKSSLCSLLTLNTEPEEGRILWDGVDVFKERSRFLPRIGFLGENPLCYAALTLEENLKFFARLYLRENPKEAVEFEMERWKLCTHRHDRLRMLSRGLVQRLSLARMFIGQPELLILDEPAITLDQEGQDLLQTALRAHCHSGGIAWVVSHDLGWISPIANGAIILKDGHTVFCGALEQDKLLQMYPKCLEARS